MRFGLVIIAAGVFAVPGTAQIAGSAHDFSNTTTTPWNTEKPNETCGVCHIPHVEGREAAAPGRTNEDLLWGRQLSAETNYTPYTSPSMDATMTQPTGSSRLCLGCHDNSVALDLFHTNATAAFGTIETEHDIRFVAPGLPGTPGSPGTSFAADHPISIDYLVSDPGLEPIANVVTNFGVTDIGEILEGGTIVQCASCHDVHNVDVPASSNSLLRIWNNNPSDPSALCNGCHVK